MASPSPSPSPSELGLDCKPSHHNNSYSMLLKSFGDHHHHHQHHHHQNDQTMKLEEFHSRLAEERLKIDAFKRELPLCMQLLNNAMEASRQQLEAFKGNEGTRPAVVLEEFMPPVVKQLVPSSESSDQKTTNPSDKANWMTSAQLWSQATDELGNKQQQHTSDHIGFNISLSPKQPEAVVDTNNNNNNNNRQRNSGGAFLPFSKERNSSTNISSHGPTLMRPLPELALASNSNSTQKDGQEAAEKVLSCQKMMISDNNNNNNNNNSNNDGVVIDHHQGNKGGSGTATAGGQTLVTQTNSTTTTTTTSNNNNNNNNNTHRKARRCWSPDLHRRFVNALQMLGGSQATPKQIRELMKVDGLTNDEVKSHLQKYRLHTRRPSPSAQTGAPAAQLVVLGGIWVPPEYATAAAAAAAHTGAATTIYGAHPTSHHHVQLPHYCAPPPPGQEFYTAVTQQQQQQQQQQLLPPPQPHHQHQHLHVYKTTPHGHGSPETAGDRSESIEDGKSESSSWKGGESCENELGGDRKGLGEETNINGSEITLKF